MMIWHEHKYHKYHPLHRIGMNNTYKPGKLLLFKK